ncbi:MAG: PilZ domain-containing protein [Planctomycetota bacterium]
MQRIRSLLTVPLALLLTTLPNGFLLAQVDEDLDSFLERWLRLRSSNFDVGVRYLVYIGFAVMLGLVVWYAHRKFSAPRKRPSRRRWHGALQRQGLDPQERDFVGHVAEQAGERDPAEVMKSRVGFEKAVGTTLDELQCDPRKQRTLDGIRRKMHWDQAQPGQPLAHTQLLELNLDVEVFGTGPQAGYCIRGVIVHRDASHLVVQLDACEERLPWIAGDRIQVYFWRPDDAGYLFTSTVQELRTRQRRPFMILSHPSALERQQKRLFVRVPYRKQLKLIRIPYSEATHRVGKEAENPTGALCEAWSEDLSAGGFRISIEHELELGDYLAVHNFPLADGEEILARVVVGLPRDGESLYRYGVQYVGLSVALRDHISRKVFQLQRESIKSAKAQDPTDGDSPPPPSHTAGAQPLLGAELPPILD